MTAPNWISVKYGHDQLHLILIRKKENKNYLLILKDIFVYFQKCCFTLQMGRIVGHQQKPRGKMTAYAFFAQTCREEHKRKHPGETVILAEFLQKCDERWKVCCIYRIFILYL